MVKLQEEMVRWWEGGRISRKEGRKKGTEEGMKGGRTGGKSKEGRKE
jgi:hypothetical protein